jgi:branched-chain amino acid transport system ATP-binding protein
MAARLHLGEPWSVVREKAEAMLQQSGLTPYALTQTQWLSQGTLRRLELARALATSPSMLLVDEPFASLSRVDKAELVALLERVRERQTSVILVAHNPRAFGMLVDRIIVLYAGRIVDELPPVGLR